MEEKQIKISWERSYGEVTGYIAPPLNRARFEQDGYYFDDAGVLLPGQKFYEPKPPSFPAMTLQQKFQSTIGRAEHIIEGKDEVPGLVDMDYWLETLPGGLEGLNKLHEYSRKNFNIRVGREMKLELMKKIVRAIYVVKATHVETKKGGITVGTVVEDDSANVETLEA